MEGAVTEKNIGSAIEVHRHLGPGLLESTSKRCIFAAFRGIDLLFLPSQKKKFSPLCNLIPLGASVVNLQTGS